MAAEQWVVTAWWGNSTSTLTGPFPDPVTADTWATRTLGATAACLSWDVSRMTAPLAAVAS